MAAVYRRVIKMPPMWVWTVSIALVALASAAFSVIEVWAHATFYKPGWRPEGVEFLGAILLDVAVLGAWTALYFGVNFYLMLSQIGRASCRERGCPEVKISVVARSL